MARITFLVPTEDMIGKHITDVMDTLDKDTLTNVLKEGKEVYSTLLQKENLALVANIAQIIIHNKIEGAIVSFQEFKKIEQLESQIRKELICSYLWQGNVIQLKKFI